MGSNPTLSVFFSQNLAFTGRVVSFLGVALGESRVKVADVAATSAVEAEQSKRNALRSL